MPNLYTIKLGGELVAPASAERLDAITSGLLRMSQAGHRFIMVHGGGPQTSELQQAMDQKPLFMGGRRVTDAQTLDAIKMVIGGRLNIDLCQALRRAGLQPVGVNGASAEAIACTRRPPIPITGSGDAPVDLGFVGDVTGVNEGFLKLLLDHGYTPVLACIGADASGQVFNINADMVANAVASAMQVDTLLLVTNTPGVLRDVRDPSSRIPSIKASEAKQLIDEGVVEGGMIPKLEESFAVIKKGVRRIIIVGHLKEGEVEAALLNDVSPVGTVLLADD